jgi:hypothetical protein
MIKHEPKSFALNFQSKSRRNKMRTILVGVVSSLVALVGFASTANASATLDLIWAGNSSTSQTIATSDSTTLNLILTNDATNIGGSVSVDYSGILGKYALVSFVNNPNGAALGYLPITLAEPVDNGSVIVGFTAAALPPYVGTGLPGGQSYLLGTMVFHKVGAGSGGTINVVLGINDSVSLGTGAGTLPASQVQLGSATLNNVPEPGTVSLLALGLAGLALAGHRKN